MSTPYLAELVACGRAFTDGTTNGVGFFARGCVVARSGAGIYTLTLDRALDADQSFSIVQGETADLDHSIVDTSDLIKTVTFAVTPGGGAADSTFKFAIFKVAGGGGATNPLPPRKVPRQR